MALHGASANCLIGSVRGTIILQYFVLKQAGLWPQATRWKLSMTRGGPCTTTHTCTRHIAPYQKMVLIYVALRHGPLPIILNGKEAILSDLVSCTMSSASSHFLTTMLPSLLPPSTTHTQGGWMVCAEVLAPWPTCPTRSRLSTRLATLKIPFYGFSGFGDLMRFQTHLAS